MKLLNQYFRKIKCFVGKHSWFYQTEVVELKLTSTNGKISTYVENQVVTRFCTHCYQKELRNRIDMNIFWKKIKLKLTPEQTRIKNLNTILHEKH